MKRLTFHPAAADEYADAVRYYSEIAPELGNSFYDEIDRLIAEIRREPNRFFEFSPPARRALARRFPYSVVYLDEPDQVWVLAITHGKRKPGYWRERM